MRPKYDGKTFKRTDKEPGHTTAENQRTWAKIAKWYERHDTASFETLTYTAFGHVSGTKGNLAAASFITYAVREGLLEQVT